MTPNDVTQIKLMGTIVGSMMITWGVAESQIRAMMNGAPGFANVRLAFDPYRILNLPAAVGGWGRPILMTPGIMAFVLAYWKSPAVSRWMMGSKTMPTLSYSGIMDGLQPDTQLDWDDDMLNKLASYADKGLVAFEGYQLLSRNYSRYMTLTLVHMALVRPYSYGLYMSGPSKANILGWGYKTADSYVREAKTAVWNQLMKYVRTSDTFQKIKAAVNQAATIGIVVTAIAILYYYN